MGLIPAWAGKTKGGTTLHQGSWAHPRVGGENALLICRLKSATGSSPRGRGKLQDFAARLQATGLIPAWAGKTAGVPWYADGRRAHPRVGGENLSSGWHPLKGPGSSPRGRGKLLLNRLSVKLSGLIPAWAGKTPRRSSSTFSSWAHPRVGGENGLDARRWPWDQGSSPRGRGKRRKCRALTARQGLIPAWAGKTRCGCATGKTRWAHPRVGGGKLEVLNTRPTPAGLIPAWAGKT